MYYEYKELLINLLITILDNNILAILLCLESDAISTNINASMFCCWRSTRSILVQDQIALIRKRTRLVHSFYWERTSLVCFWTSTVQIQTSSAVMTDDQSLKQFRLDINEQEDQVQGDLIIIISLKSIDTRLEQRVLLLKLY